MSKTFLHLYTADQRRTGLLASLRTSWHDADNVPSIHVGVTYTDER